jgi:hypothetical protein
MHVTHGRESELGTAMHLVGLKIHEFISKGYMVLCLWWMHSASDAFDFQATRLCLVCK